MKNLSLFLAMLFGCLTLNADLWTEIENNEEQAAIESITLRDVDRRFLLTHYGHANVLSWAAIHKRPLIVTALLQRGLNPLEIPRMGSDRYYGGSSERPLFLALKYCELSDYESIVKPLLTVALRIMHALDEQRSSLRSEILKELLITAETYHFAEARSMVERFAEANGYLSADLIDDAKQAGIEKRRMINFTIIQTTDEPALPKSPKKRPFAGDKSLKKSDESPKKIRDTNYVAPEKPHIYVEPVAKTELMPQLVCVETL